MYTNDPRVINAKFNCVCSESGAVIKKGAECIYYPLSKQVFSMNSKQAVEYFEWKQDLAMNYNY
jgi:hypothetical protein